MAVQDEVNWLIGIIKTNWSGTFPSDLARRNRDEPKTIFPDDTEQREFGIELMDYNVVSVSKNTVNREIRGTKPQYLVNTILGVRVEALIDEEHGEVSDVNDFETIVRKTQEAINNELNYPSVDESPSDTTGVIVYHDLRIQNDQSLSSDYKDYFRYDFDVRLRGFQDTP